MLMQERLAADGLLYLSPVLFVGINGEVRLRFATPDVYAGGCRLTEVRGSQVRRRVQTGRGRGRLFSSP